MSYKGSTGVMANNHRYQISKTSKLTHLAQVQVWETHICAHMCSCCLECRIQIQSQNFWATCPWRNDVQSCEIYSLLYCPLWTPHCKK